MSRQSSSPPGALRDLALLWGLVLAAALAGVLEMWGHCLPPSQPRRPGGPPVVWSVEIGGNLDAVMDLRSRNGQRPLR